MLKIRERRNLPVINLLHLEGSRLLKIEHHHPSPKILLEREEVMEIVTSWMEQGIELGIEQGLIQGELRIIKRQIKVKIGEISPQLLDKIRTLSNPKLEDLSDALLDFSTEENLAAWLEQNAGNSINE